MSEQNVNQYDQRPRVCRSCGAIIGAGEEVCAQCGAALAPQGAPAPPRHFMYDREAMRFARAVLSRPHTFTILFLAANLFVFLLMWSSSGFQSRTLMEFPTPVLIAYGAKLNVLIDARPHQWWRFVTPIFIHVNLPHILVNMWSLWVVGPYVEKLYGSAKFVVFWVVTGVAGVLASYLTVRPDLQVTSLGRFLFKPMDNPSAGASGALFGLVGVLFVFGIKFRHELPEGFKRAFGTGLLPMILINIFIGYLGRGIIDNAAHMGGLFAGAGLALFAGYKRPGERKTAALFWHVFQLAALLLVAASFLMVARNFPAEIPIDEGARQGYTRVGAYLKALSHGEESFIEAFNKNEKGRIEESIKELKGAPALDDRATEIRDELVTILEKVRELEPKPEKPTRRQIEERNNLLQEFKAWQEKHLEWARANRERYGLQITEEQNDNSPSEKESGSNKNSSTKD